ncbi:MAG: thiamine pyrophosphate-binding protein [Bacteroidetes bacterium]|nr:MAG: thiamine pyrophosphate-binding protein [Bacteroidota bacterium]
MKKTAAELTVFALEQIGVKYTFGIPGVHNTEIYDGLNSSKQIEPILVTHEGGASFMADGVSRTSDNIGTLVIVPAAGATHAASGIGEAYLDGVPMLVISGGTRTDTGRHYQLHQIDQEKIVGGITKAYFLVERHEDVISTIYKAYDIAVSGEPGPVFVEIPVNLQLFRGGVSGLPEYTRKKAPLEFDLDLVKRAVDLLTQAAHPAIYVGWGAVDASEPTRRIADQLVAPVATTVQGKSAFPADHPMHTGVGFGLSSKPAGQNAFANCDCMLAVGVRFSELATGSYGIEEPQNLIHVDINPEVFDKNYQTKIAIEGDANTVLKAIAEELEARDFKASRIMQTEGDKIKSDNQKYYAEWLGEKKTDLVSPGHFFKALRAQADHDAFMVVDDGKHTFLAAELFDVYQPRHFISPTDFNAMGYCVPAAIGCKLSNPDKQVIAIVGDGGFLMTGMELITATTNGLAPIVFVFHDGELGQISQFQAIPLNRKTCTKIGQLNVEGIAIATGAHFISMENDAQIVSCIDEAIQATSEGRPVLVDVKIDYSKKTMLTKGVIKINLSRFPLKEKVRFIGRAIGRHVFK